MAVHLGIPNTLIDDVTFQVTLQSYLAIFLLLNHLASAKQFTNFREILTHTS